MRASLVLLAALAACSDSSGPRHVPELTTQLASSVATVDGPVLAVTLNATNPTDTTIQLSFSLPAVLVQIKVGGAWQSGGGPFSDGFGSGRDTTVSLIGGAWGPLGTAYLAFLPPSNQQSAAPALFPNTEQFTLSPGVYSVRACYYPDTSSSQGGSIVHAQCGNSVSLTLLKQ